MDYSKYNKYKEEMEKLLEQPYFARVNNKTAVKMGELKPYDNPFWDFNNGGNKKKKRRGKKYLK